MHFRDRNEAGRLLAGKLAMYADHPDVLVLALPRGGVPVGYQVAQALRVPLDVLLVRKLGMPGREELAMGAIASGGGRVINAEMVQALGIPDEIVEAVAEREQRELQRRERAYRADRPPLEVEGRTILLVDDGLATGATMRAAVAALRKQGPARIVVAVPVGAAETCELLRKEADEVVCLFMPEAFAAVGIWYDDFSQTPDDQVRQLLQQAERAGT